MGSFANSLHVKSGSSDAVAASIAAILKGEGWQPTEKVPSRGATWSVSSPLRALQVSAPQNGWVSILDTDFSGAHALTPALAERLSAHAIFFLVNDSDSWCYLLAGPDGAVSEFDSAEDADDDEDSGELVEAGAAIAKIQALMSDGTIQQRIHAIQAQMAATAPPEIRAAETRIRSGQGTAADMHQYQAWATQEMPKYMADMKALLGGALDLPKLSAPQTSKHRTSKAERTAQKQRRDALRPILAEGITDEQVQNVLDQQVAFAEEVLAEFMPLVNLPAYYANLSYGYLDESSPQELAGHGIRFVQHLRFETT